MPTTEMQESVNSTDIGKTPSQCKIERYKKEIAARTTKAQHQCKRQTAGNVNRAFRV